MRRVALALALAVIAAVSPMGCVIRTGPPPARFEVRPVVPYPEAVWIDGHWEHRYGGWAWSQGYWARVPFPGAIWVPGHWRESPEGWRWVPGHWR